MSTDTMIMVVLICVGTGMGLAGLSFLGYRVFTLVKAGKDTGIKSKAQVQEITGRVQRLAPRIRDLQAKQEAVAEKLSSLSTTAHESD